MSIYVVGDIQGCFRELSLLLQKVDFSPSRDKLIALGDVVNRGPESLKVLRFCRDLGSSFDMVLGNHDLHIFVLHYGIYKAKQDDTLQSVLSAPDIDDILSWLSHKSFIIKHQDNLLMHAGIYPDWDGNQAIRLSDEVSSFFKDNIEYFTQSLYGDYPRKWSDDLEGIERYRCIVNIFTRMRFLQEGLKINFKYKGHPKDTKDGLYPWFSFSRKSTESLVFGHWASLHGITNVEGVHALDTGCVWGGELTLMNIDTKERMSINSV